MFTIIKIFSILILFRYCAAMDIEVYNMTISLDRQPTFGNKEIFGEFISLHSHEVLRINFDNINPNISFVVLQVHAYNYTVYLYKNPVWIYTLDTVDSGEHVGLYSDVLNEKDIFYLINNNPGVHLKFYVSVHGYGLQDPIPGGCNMESVIPIAPFLNMTIEIDYMNVDVAPPMDPTDPKCMRPKAVIEFYMMYMPQFDYSPETFYDSIKRMMTLESIRKNGVLVPRTFWRTRRMLSLYRATGVVFVAVAKSTNGYSVYVPSHTYGCRGNDLSCIGIGDYRTILTCLYMIVVSACVCFMGHTYFVSMISFTALLSSICVFVIIFDAIYGKNNLDALLLVITMSLAVAFTGLWLIFYWVFGLPVIGVLLPAMDVGFLVASIIYYRLPPDLTYLQSDFNFWTLFILVNLLVALALVSATYIGHLLSCAFFGAYGIVMPLDILIGGNLKFIFVSTWRRATTPNFNKAVLLPPYQTCEKVMTAVWVIFAISGFVVQYLYNRGKPPFPPPPRQINISTEQPLNSTSQRNISTEQPLNSMPQRNISTEQPLNSTSQRNISTEQPLNSMPQRNISTEQPLNSMPQRNISTEQPLNSTSQRNISTEQPLNSMPQRNISTEQPLNSTQQRKDHRYAGRDITRVAAAPNPRADERTPLLS